jgi:hypothetical protein
VQVGPFMGTTHSRSIILSKTAIPLPCECGKPDGGTVQPRSNRTALAGSPLLLCLFGEYLEASLCVDWFGFVVFSLYQEKRDPSLLVLCDYLWACTRMASQRSMWGRRHLEQVLL